MHHEQKAKSHAKGFAIVVTDEEIFQPRCAARGQTRMTFIIRGAKQALMQSLFAIAHQNGLFGP
eukprot:6203385-Pleurochrysis_carterae.AAC.2